MGACEYPKPVDGESESLPPPRFRSPFNPKLALVFYLSHNVQAPELHRSQGWVTVTHKDGDLFDWSNTPAGQYFQVLYSQKPPENAFLSVPYKKGYYYIADEDLNTKSTFLLLLHLQSLQAGKNHEVNSPTLMIPIGG